MHENRSLNLSGIDVGPTRDDHVGLSVAEEEKAVFVEVPNISDREEGANAIISGLLFVVVILKGSRLH